MKKLFRNIHLWLSVPFGILITLICFSGAMLVFEQEIVQLTHAHLYKVERPSPDAKPLPLNQLAASVEATLPGDVHISALTVPANPTDACRVTLSKPKRAAIYIDPYTGEIKGHYERTPFFQAMFRLHRWLLGSRPADGGIFWGKLIVGISTLLFVGVLLSGVVVWWPRTGKALKNSLKIVFGRGWSRLAYGLHVAGGMYVLLFLLVMALTGLTWSFDWYRNGFYALFGVETQTGNKQVHASDKNPQNGTKAYCAADTNDNYACWQQVYEQLAARNPGYRQITLSANHQAMVSYDRLGNVRGTDRYDFNASTGQLTSFNRYEEQALSGKIRGWIYSVHVGSFGGWTTRILWFLAALLGASLPLTGYYLWIRKLVRRSR